MMVTSYQLSVISYIGIFQLGEDCYDMPLNRKLTTDNWQLLKYAS